MVRVVCCNFDIFEKKGNENFPISVVMPPLMKHEAV